ncbi:carbohydrate porin [Thiosulfativibrio zosterae]|uniref:Uncharacterized protein n=1 Tax=Thiosulfativibrio zosterae TaxID=2675053 RepID=A0A6F8PMM8_9GAMM|nr:carbohydrate porin [Thiosulfativibrio zosterae]BBP43359.1 hypothetical protein THMIRHAT_11050 [Thiosulfativibrio zosterae]
MLQLVNLRYLISSLVLLNSLNLSAAETPQKNWTYDGVVTVIYQHPSESQISSNATLSGDLNLNFLWHKTRFYAHLEAATTPQAGGAAQVLPQTNADSGSAIDDRNQGRIQLSELYFSHKLTPKTQFTAGLLDATAFMDTSVISNDENLQFISAPLVNNPIIDFPDYALGMVLEQKLQPKYFGRLLISSSHGLADNASRNYSQAFELGKDEKGAFINAELSYQPKAQYFTAGVWTHTAPHESLNDPQNNHLINFGGYLNAYKKIERHSLETRLAYANPEVSTGEWFWSLAYEYKRPNWVLGSGYSWTKASDKMSDSRYQKNAQLLEVYVRHQPFKNFFISPSIQWIENPLYDQNVWQLSNPIWSANIRFSYLFE